MSNDQPNLTDRTKDVSKHTKDVAVDQIRLAATIGSEAVSSGVYLYPLEGIYYLLGHPKLWKPMRKPLLYSLALSIFITVNLFIWTYLPQVAVLAIVNGPLAFVTVVPLILSESAAITLFVARAFWLAPALDNVFDEVLLKQGLTDLVAQGRQVDGTGKSKRLGATLMSPLNRFSKEGIIRYLLSLPLNAIPVVGTVFFLFYNGNKAGPGHHSRYFQLKHYSDAQQKDFVAKHKGSYTAFGTASMALNLIPGLSIFFAFATAAGAALWAADMEKKMGANVDTDASDEASQDVSNVAKKIH